MAHRRLLTSYRRFTQAADRDTDAIEGTSSFDQIYSVRQTLRQCGHIDISAHFAEWAKPGPKLGKMYEAKVLAEAGGGSGTVGFGNCSMSAVK